MDCVDIHIHHKHTTSALGIYWQIHSGDLDTFGPSIQRYAHKPGILSVFVCQYETLLSHDVQTVLYANLHSETVVSRCQNLF